MQWPEITPELEEEARLKSMSSLAVICICRCCGSEDWGPRMGCSQCKSTDIYWRYLTADNRRLDDSEVSIL